MFSSSVPASGALPCRCRGLLTKAAAQTGAGAARQLLSLEKCSGAAKDAALWESGIFGAAVYPDLPTITSLRQIHWLLRYC